MLVSELISRSGVTPEGLIGDAEISSIVSDSREVKPGALFVCMPGKNADSHAFIPQAIENGALAVLAYSREGFEKAKALGACAFFFPISTPATAIRELTFPEAVWRIAKEFHGNLTHDMKVVGITGTN